MFAAGGWTMIFGILLGLSIILGSVYFVHKMFVGNVQDILVRFILLVFTALTALFKTLVLMILSYYFGTKSDTNKSDKSNHI